MKEVKEIRLELIKILNKKFDEWKERKAHVKKPDLVNELFEASGADHNLDRILNQLMVLFIAGTDTTGHLLAHATYALSQNPEILEALRKEMDSKITSKNDLVWEKLSDLPYLTAVLRETMRLYTFVNEIFPREAIENHKLGDLTIKKGWLVTHSFLMSFFNPEYFKDLFEFKPERLVE